VPLSTHEVYRGTTKAANNKKENPTTLKNPSPQTQNHRKTPTLHHVRFAFPTLGGHARITVIDGAYQIQNFPPTFGL
jgi:hypothetical protein